MPLAVGAYARFIVSDGQWWLDEGTLRLRLQTEGLSRGDITLPSGGLDLCTPVLGPALLSKNKGMVTILQRRWWVRLERRIVGTFRAEEVEMEGGEEPKALPSVRIKRGTLDGAVYE